MIERITKAQQIIDIIEPIPADKFCVNEYAIYANGNNEPEGDELPISCCFLGHIHMSFGNDPYGDAQGYGARQLTKHFLENVHRIDANGAAVNNAPTVNGYNEPVIKDRLMHMLRDMVEAGY